VEEDERLVQVPDDDSLHVRFWIRALAAAVFPAAASARALATCEQKEKGKRCILERLFLFSLAAAEVR